MFRIQSLRLQLLSVIKLEHTFFGLNTNFTKSVGVTMAAEQNVWQLNFLGRFCINLPLFRIIIVIRKSTLVFNFIFRFLFFVFFSSLQGFFLA